jgi:hypothetical protein
MRWCHPFAVAFGRYRHDNLMGGMILFQNWLAQAAHPAVLGQRRV